MKSLDSATERSLRGSRPDDRSAPGPNRSGPARVSKPVPTSARLPLAAVGSGEPTPSAGFADSVRPCWPAMAKLARHLAGPNDWEDVLQDALSAAWRKRAQFDEDRGSLRSWLLAIVVDQARKHDRRTWSRVSTLSLHDEPTAEHHPAALDPLPDLDLERALRRLTPRQRSVVALFYFLDLPVTELAMILDCSPGTIKSTLSDARARLRSELQEGRS